MPPALLNQDSHYSSILKEGLVSDLAIAAAATSAGTAI